MTQVRPTYTVERGRPTRSRPPKMERDVFRRDQIVVAAQSCVVRHGFHATSMAQIAATAGMSVGQIYRYFPGKDAIVHAIVERIVAKRLLWIDSHAHDGDLVERAAARMLDADAEERDDKVLLLEATAEASRNPAVAAILRAAHARLRASGAEMLRKFHPELSEEQAALRVELMAVLAEGTAFRMLVALPGEQPGLRGLYREVIGAVLHAT
jgi:AcrR family transcriptional regulator